MKTDEKKRAWAVTMQNRGATLEDTARVFEVTTRTVQRWINRYYQENPNQPRPRRFRRSTPEERKAAYELREGGTKTSYIAFINDVSPNTVRKWIAKHRETLTQATEPTTGNDTTRNEKSPHEGNTTDLHHTPSGGIESGFPGGRSAPTRGPLEELGAERTPPVNPETSPPVVYEAPEVEKDV